jgi:hypothetical protein
VGRTAGAAAPCSAHRPCGCSARRKPERVAAPRARPARACFSAWGQPAAFRRAAAMRGAFNGTAMLIAEQQRQAALAELAERSHSSFYASTSEDVRLHCESPTLSRPLAAAGARALIRAGCGASAQPNTRGNRALRRRGAELAHARRDTLTRRFAPALSLTARAHAGRVAARALPPPLAARPGARGAARGGARAGTGARGEQVRRVALAPLASLFKLPPRRCCELAPLPPAALRLHMRARAAAWLHPPGR